MSKIEKIILEEAEAKKEMNGFLIDYKKKNKNQS